MTIQSLISYLEKYPKDTEIKIIVDDTEEDIRCMIYSGNLQPKEFSPTHFTSVYNIDDCWAY